MQTMNATGSLKRDGSMARIRYQCAERQQCGWEGDAQGLSFKPKQFEEQVLQAYCPKCDGAFLWVILP